MVIHKKVLNFATSNKNNENINTKNNNPLTHTVMKKIKTWMMMIATIMMAGIMASCDSDQKLAFRLDGAWYGDFGMNYTYIDRRGQAITVDSYDTYLKFYNDGIAASHGWGKQVDYYRYGPYERLYYRFEWRIRDGVIHITYPCDPQLSVDIYDYSLKWGHFTGWFGDSDVHFDLRSLSTDYDWDIYTGNYYEYCYTGWHYDGYGWYESYYPYYAKTRTTDTTEVQTNANSTEVQADVQTPMVMKKSPSMDSSERRILKIGNRYMNNLQELDVPENQEGINE